MIKKFILLIFLINIVSGCGFSPLYSNKNAVNFSINEIKFEGDRILNNFIKANLNRYQNDKFDKKFTISVTSEYRKNILSKDKAAKITSYELSSNAIFEISTNGKIIKKLMISEKNNLNNIDDDFEEQKNERIIKQNFASAMSSKLITELSILNDN